MARWVVETRSFSKAAAEVAITQPTATKAIAASGERLGARLLHRSTRGVTPTEVGALYCERCKAIERAIDEAESQASQVHRGAGGLLRISTSVTFGRRILAPLVLQYMQEVPAVHIDISFDDRYVDLVEQGMDLAIRMGQMADSNLGARYLGSNTCVMVASQPCLDRHGEPADSDELGQRACIVYSSVQGDDRWRLSPPARAAVSIPVGGPFRSNNLSAVLAAASAGMGLRSCPGMLQERRLLRDGCRP